MLRLSLTVFLLAGYALAGIILPRQNSTDSNSSTTVSQCSTYMCVNATTRGDEIQCHILSSTGKMTPGWMGMGFGTSMAGSPMVIMWSNSDGSVTLSQRQASGHTMPTVVSSPARVATMEDSLTTTSGDGIQFAFNIPSDGNTNPDIIWAFGDESPSSAAADATIAIHLDKGQTKLNFAAANGTNTGTNNDTQSSGALSLLPGHESVVVLLLILGMIVAV